MIEMDSDIETKLRDLGVLGNGEIEKIRITLQSVKLKIRHREGGGSVRVSIPLSDLGMKNTVVEDSGSRPWEEPGWLLHRYKKYGSFTEIVKAEVPSSDSATLRNYAHRIGWRTFDGLQIKRWEVVKDYFKILNPNNRPALGKLAKRYKLSRTSVFKYVDEAREGVFFAKTFDYQRLQALQLKDSEFIYFPETGEDIQDYSLPKTRGWPHLPRGLVNDFLPRLDLKFVRLETKKKVVIFHLTHQDQPIAFSASLEEPPPTNITSVNFSQSVDPDERDTFVIHAESDSGEHRMVGRINTIVEASSNNTYNLK